MPPGTPSASVTARGAPDDVTVGVGVAPMELELVGVELLEPVPVELDDGVPVWLPVPVELDAGAADVGSVDAGHHALLGALAG